MDWQLIVQKMMEEKTLKYGPLRWELKQQYKGYTLEQYNIIIDVLGDWSCSLDTAMQKLLGAESAGRCWKNVEAVRSRECREMLKECRSW